VIDCAELAETLRRAGVRAAIRAAIEQASKERGAPVAAIDSLRRGEGMTVLIEPSPARAT
jgi:hypothetical protein